MARITNEEELVDAIALMRGAGTDVSDYELKEAAAGFPKSALESISAFANTHGGVLILGVSEKTFEAVDLDVKKVQSALAQALRDRVVPAVSADVDVLRLGGKPVLVANIPELAARQKPCYVKTKGRVEGSYIRTGEGDYRMTLYELDRFIENQHRLARNDVDIVPDAEMSDLDSDSLKAWLDIQRNSSLGRGNALSDEELMINRRVVAVDSAGNIRPTVAGVMALGKFPQKFFPRLNVVFTAYPASVKGEDSPRGERFLDSENLDGSIPAMLVDALRAVSRNIRHGAIIRAGLRADVPDYPLDAVREAVANALMHRDYSRDAQGAPVRVDLYPDRLEVINPGGLFGALTVDQLNRGNAGTQSRNQFLARLLEDVAFTDVDGRSGHVVENRGTGFPIMRHALADALMDPPLVFDSLDEFRIVFRHRRMTEYEGESYSRDNMEKAILSFLSERGSASTAELSASAGVSTKTIREYVNTLLDEGLVEGIGSKYSPKRRYRLAGR